MENTIYIGLSRQIGLRREMDTVAHNIANMSTPGYKAERLMFREYVDEPARGERLSMVQDVGLARDLSEGPAETTGNPLDVALHGEGYFVVETPLGERYTRHGRFQLDAEGQLVTGEGHPVQGQAGAITLPPGGGPVQIASDGTISNDDGIVGRLSVVTFEDEQAMRKAANGLYSTDQDPQAIDRPSMTQGMIESSNVEGILEMTRMIQVSRSYASISRFLSQQDDLQKQMITTLGKAPGA